MPRVWRSELRSDGGLLRRGHWVQMRCIPPAFDGMELVFVGVEPEPDGDLGAVRYYQVRNVTRRIRWRCRASSAGSSR